MALKIVRTTGPEQGARPLRLWLAGRRDEALAALAEPATAEHPAEVGQLIERALADDLALAGTLGSALAAWEDDVEAYRLVRAAAEGLLDRADDQGPARWAPSGVALCELTLPLLEARPLEPVLLNYLGVALYGINEAPLALQLFQGVRRLDPSVENLRGNLEAAAGRARTPVRLLVAPSLLPALKSLRARASRLAARIADLPQPGSISLCMIVRDEEEMLPGCLDSVQGAVDELVIVDTGSTDRTVEIAESYGARVLHAPWTGSFSEARNVGLEAATCEWILWLDADERLEDGDGPGLRALTRRPFREAYWLVETNYTGQEEVGTAVTHQALRLWRNRAAYRFRGAIHEQIRVSMPMDLAERFEATTLRLRHYGYLKQRVDARDKHTRNLELLLPELEREPGSHFTHFNVGTEYLLLGDVTRGRLHLEEAYRLMRAGDWLSVGYAPLLSSRLVAARRMCADYAGADALASELLETFPSFTDLFFERACCAHALGDAAAAQALLERCLELGDAPAEHCGVVGKGGFLALSALADLAEERGDSAAAEALLERSLREHPTFLAAGFELAQLLLAEEGAEPDAVAGRLAAYDRSELTWWVFLGTAFYEAGHAVHGERYFRRALEVTPQHPAARVGLAEALLSQHRYAEVGEEAGDLPANTPAFAAGQRLRALAAALDGDAAAVEAAAAALGAGGGDPADPATLRAVGAAIAGAAPRPLDPACAGGVLQMLDGLARLEEFDAFERVAPLVEAALHDPREATLALGELYLSRGFYRLAAESAMAALEGVAPDARALALLGKSAVAEGMFEDAIPVLQGSLELDPDQPSVARLLDDLQQRSAA